MAPDSFLYLMGALTCVASSVFLYLWHCWTRRKMNKPLEKGQFGFPVTDWKSYQEDNAKHLARLKKAIEEHEDSWTPEDQKIFNKKPVVRNDNEEKADESGEEDFGDQNLPTLEKTPTEERIDAQSGSVWVSEEVGLEDLPGEESLSGKLKTAKLRQVAKKVEADMTDEQKEEEAEVRRRQLAQIFDLMSKEQSKFGVKSVDDVQEQMRLYNL